MRFIVFKKQKGAEVAGKGTGERKGMEGKEGEENGVKGRGWEWRERKGKEMEEKGGEGSG